MYSCGHKVIKTINSGETWTEIFTPKTEQLSRVFFIDQTGWAVGEECKCRITANTAIRIAWNFNMTPQFWLGLQMDYDLDLAENRLAGKLDTEIQV